MYRGADFRCSFWGLACRGTLDIGSRRQLLLHGVRSIDQHLSYTGDRQLVSNSLHKVVRVCPILYHNRRVKSCERKPEVTRATFLHSIIVHLNIKVRDVLILHPKTKAALNLC